MARHDGDDASQASLLGVIKAAEGRRGDLQWRPFFIWLNRTFDSSSACNARHLVHIRTVAADERGLHRPWRSDEAIQGRGVMALGSLCSADHVSIRLDPMARPRAAASAVRAMFVAQLELIAHKASVPSQALFPRRPTRPILVASPARAAMAINGHRNKSFGPGGGTRRLHPNPPVRGRVWAGAK
jgi:hypothetical protein